MVCFAPYTFAKDLKEGYSYKKITAVVFLAALMVQVFSSAWIMADYHVNQIKYARYCINKARPQLRCNGKCQVMKKLQEEENKAGQNPGRKCGNKNELVYAYRSFFSTVEKIGIIQKGQNDTPFYQDAVVKGCLISIFHPPKEII